MCHRKKTTSIAIFLWWYFSQRLQTRCLLQCSNAEKCSKLEKFETPKKHPSPKKNVERKRSTHTSRALLELVRVHRDHAPRSGSRDDDGLRVGKALPRRQRFVGRSRRIGPQRRVTQGETIHQGVLAQTHASKSTKKYKPLFFKCKPKKKRRTTPNGHWISHLREVFEFVCVFFRCVSVLFCVPF